jgi:chitodextrinase
MLLLVCLFAPVLWAGTLVQSTTYTGTTTVAGPDTIDTASGATITVANTANVTYLASSSIRLGPGFTATAGSTFHAVIGTDNSAPSVPANPGTSAANATSLTFSWSAASDNVGVTAYEVSVGGNFYDTTTDTSLVVAGLSPSTTYSFTVQARDAAGNGSGWSSAVNGTTTNAPDTTPPSTPGNVHVTAFDQSSVTFAWDAASDNVGVTGYWVRVNQGTAQLVTGLSHTFPGLASNTNYTLEVSARDAFGNTSQSWGSTSATTSNNDPNASVWMDVDGDGIRDEIVRPHTDFFEYAIGQWYTPVVQYAYHPVNNFWNLVNMFYGGGTQADGFGWEFNDSAAQFYITTETRFGLVFYIMLDAHEPYKVFRDLTDSDQLNPANWEYIFGSETGSDYSTQHEFHWDVPNPFQLVNSKYFVVKYGRPVGSVQLKDSEGNDLTGNVLVNGTLNLFLPTNSQINFGVLNTVGTAISSVVHNIIWRIKDAVGTILREGTGLNVDLDGLNLLQIAQLSVKLDAAPERMFSLNVLELKQLNYPTSTGTTDLGQRQEKRIGRGGIAYITGEPAMPQLEARISNAPSGVTEIEWKMSVASEHPKRGERDNLSVPQSGVVTVPVAQAWKTYESAPGFFGGNCVITFRLKGPSGYFGPAETFSFKIRGKNPKDADAKAYIQQNQGSAYRFLWAIAQHDSRLVSRVYNQFNTSGDNVEQPNWGFPDGWGIGQIDKSAEESSATTSQVYDWHANIAEAKIVLQAKASAQQVFFDAVARTYPNDAEAQSAPASFTPPQTSTTLSALEAGMITLYNGAGGCPQSTLIGPSGTNITYRNPWRFLPSNPSGQKWQFSPNTNNYLFKVIHDEVEAQAQIQE